MKLSAKHVYFCLVNLTLQKGLTLWLLCLDLKSFAQERTAYCRSLLRFGQNRLCEVEPTEVIIAKPQLTCFKIMYGTSNKGSWSAAPELGKRGHHREDKILIGIIR